MNTNPLNAAENKTNRRSFLRRTTASVAAFSVVPGYVLGTRGQTPPIGKLNIAGIGVGGMGNSNLKKCAEENIVALCDVDQNYAAKTYKEYPQGEGISEFPADAGGAERH